MSIKKTPGPRRAAAVLALAATAGTLVAGAAAATPVRTTPAYGPDRYVTSVMAADDPTATAFIVTGENFPDGLSAGAVAGTIGGNVYLTPQRQLTREVREQVVYAQRIVVVGSERAVGPDVMTWLRQNTRAELSRVDGVDRYATAANLSHRFYSTPAGAGDEHAHVVVATGEDFPDALAGSAAAAHEESPLLLVQRDAVPAATAAELVRLRPRAISVVGGAGKVSDAVLRELQRYTDAPVDRIAGADRYETAVAVSRAFFDTADDVVLASGAGFADALPAGAAAGRRGGPLLLAPGDCVPEFVNLEIERVEAGYGPGATRLYSVGGAPSFTEQAAKRTNCRPAGAPALKYLDELPWPTGSARFASDHATMAGRFYPRSPAYDTDPRNSDYRTWKLGAAYSRFTMVAGVADGNTSGTTSTVEVYGDERLLARAEVRRGAPAPFDVDVRGVDNLKIVTTTPGTTPVVGSLATTVYLGDAAVR
ncbi:cell wall-binding repeat-containing protein [Kineococcus sp. SYSU DK005]|uniref:cell wall-binding repeat-containing protein n=1 Tax=Kineococcus sp. SYSU DK005 TaxID=3383126 RepID=UPI003D7D69B3